MGKIPRIIHYCWFGGKSKPPLVKKCIRSWEKFLPEYEIKEWNESNFDASKHTYTRMTAKIRKWGYFTDYVRFSVLHEYGGIYLDSDVEVIKPFDPLLSNDFFMGYENEDTIGTAVIGSVQNHSLLKKILTVFDDLDKVRLGPDILTSVYEEYDAKDYITVYPTKFFYPFAYYEQFNPKCITKDTYAIHWWLKSWFGFKEYVWMAICKFPLLAKLLTRTKQFVVSKRGGEK